MKIEVIGIILSVILALIGLGEQTMPETNNWTLSVIFWVFAFVVAISTLIYWLRHRQSNKSPLLVEPIIEGHTVKLRVLNLGNEGKFSAQAIANGKTYDMVWENKIEPRIDIAHDEMQNLLIATIQYGEMKDSFQKRYIALPKYIAQWDYKYGIFTETIETQKVRIAIIITAIPRLAIPFEKQYQLELIKDGWFIGEENDAQV